jgi:small-conductance mechanosensitive channel
VDLSGFGRVLLIFAAVLVLLGDVLLLMGKGVLPRIPGNLSFGSGSVRVFVPLGACILVSLLLTVLLNLFLRK